MRKITADIFIYFTGVKGNTAFDEEITVTSSSQQATLFK